MKPDSTAGSIPVRRARTSCSASIWRFSFGVVCQVVIGCFSGAMVYVAALAITPTESTSIPQFDRQLSQRVGLLLPVVMGFWVGWRRHQWSWLVAGAVVGLLLGVIYWWLATEHAGFTVVVLPTLLTGVASLLSGWSNDSTSSKAWRMLLGSLAGGVLGVVYVNVLDYFDLLEGLDFKQTVEQYVTEKWMIGPPAFSIACGLFCPLFFWASGRGSSAGAIQLSRL